MNGDTIKTSLAALGRELSAGDPVELVIVGGAAGLLTGQLSPAVTTGDVDAISVLPADQWHRVQEAAALVTTALGLPANWLNRDVGLHRLALPPDYRSRLVIVGEFGSLTVKAIGRLDLIAMKFYAHRQRDVEHLLEFSPTGQEKRFVLDYLNALESAGVGEPSQIQMAKHVLTEWK